MGMFIILDKAQSNLPAMINRPEKKAQISQDNGDSRDVGDC